METVPYPTSLFWHMYMYVLHKYNGHHIQCVQYGTYIWKAHILQISHYVDYRTDFLKSHIYDEYRKNN